VFYTINPHEKCVVTSQRQTKKGERMIDSLAFIIIYLRENAKLKMNMQTTTV